MICAPPDEGGGIETIVIAAIGPADRLALDGAIIGEVVERHPPARRIDRCDDLLRDRPGVEAGRALGGDRLERRGEIVERDVIAGLRDAAVGRRKMRADDGWLASAFAAERQGIGDVVVDGEPLPRERDRRRDQIGEREFAGAVFAPGELEAGDGSGHADREPGIARLERIGLAVGVEKDVLRRRGGRGLAIVDGDRLD